MNQREFFKELMLFIKGIITERTSIETLAEGTADLIKEFEQEIRKDQDKITRQACAESVSKLEPIWVCDNESGIDPDKVHQAIINTKAI